MKKNSLLYLLAIGLILLPVSAEARRCPWWWPNCPWGNTTTTTVNPTTTTVNPTTTTTIADFQMGYYQCAPLFTVTEVTPNILIILDNSGSMNYVAYGYESGDYQPDNFDPDINYYGYFDTSATYTYSAGVFKRDANYTSGHWDGKFLNWLTMRRVDVARKVLIGGDTNGSRDGTGETILYGEDSVQDSRRYIKFYEHVSQYTPLAHDYYFFRLESDGTFMVYEIEDPGQFDFTANFSYICNGNDQRDWYFHDYLFDRQADTSDNSYDIEKINPTENPPPECDDGDYNHATNGDYAATYNVRVEKDDTTEPDLFLDGNIVGVLQRVGDKARFGLEFYNSYDGGKIGNYVGGNLTDLINNIEDKGCDTWTPLAESFYEGVRYYRQDVPYYDSGDYTVSQNNDPFYFQDEGEYVECSKSFILLISDGASTKDENIPSTYRDYDSDGNDPGSYSDDGTDYLDDVALWAHTNDMRTGAKDLEGEQIINLFTVFAFGSGSQLLKDAAKNGGFIDINDNGEPDLDREWDKDGDGVPDNYLEAPDGNQLEYQIMVAITDILQESASGTAVSILSTSSEGEGSLYQAHFKPVVFDNLRKVDWVGYLNSLWVDTYGNIREDTVHDNALVYGDDKIIKFTIDAGSGNTAIERYHDNTGGGPDKDEPDGLADSDTPYETVLVSELEPQWEAGEKLAMRDASSRTIKTWVDLDGDGEVDTATEVIDFTVANAAILRPFMGINDSTKTLAENIADTEDIIRFVRGEEVAGFRDRNITIEGTEYVWKLGDIVYSTPTVVGRPMENYHQYYSDVSYAQFFMEADYTKPGDFKPWEVKLWRDRAVTVYVGANDGMLHAFKGGDFHEGDDPDTGKEEHGWYSADERPMTPGEELGDERWAYIPYNLLPHLQWLPRIDYPHIYYVDLKPKVTDVRIFTDDDTHPNGWGTILIGGMRLGGEDITLTDDFDGDGTDDAGRTFRSAYFVLDITDPTSPALLGEFTDPNMGLTTSYPAIARVEASHGFDNPENDEWFVVVGSGPTDCDGSSNQNGRLFIYSLDLDNGIMDMVNGGLVQTIQTVENDAIMATPVTLDLNLNYNVDTIYIGETYEQGVDEIGKMYRISTRNDNNPAPGANPWPYEIDPSSNPWLMTTFFSSITPINASPTASVDEDENIWVYFGTGKYYNSDDKNNTTTQYFYGIKDACAYGVCGVSDEVALADLYNSTTIDILSNGEVENATANTWDAFVDEVQAEEGWYISLATGGERVLTRPNILGGVVLFAPYKPLPGLCQSGGTGALYALYYETGTAYHKPIIGTIAYGDGRDECLKGISLGEGLTSEIGIHVGRKAESTGFIQQGTGAVTQVEIDPAFSIKSGIIGWMQY